LEYHKYIVYGQPTPLALN